MMKGAVRHLLFASVAGAAVAVSTPSLAQTTEGASETSGLGEIIVTAQRREERNQDVPIAITAFTPETLQKNNITDAQGLNGLVPSMTIGSKGQGSRDTMSPTIRGQGATFQAAPGVVVYMSEVPLAPAYTLSMQGGHGNFVDLENVQVLSGPQGTLFGRNTTGGAVLLTPKKPTNDFEGYIEGSLGNYDLRGLEGAINVPVVDDKLMIRVTGAYRDRDGFTKDLVWNKRRDDTHWYMGRIGVLMKPTEGLTNYFMAFGSRSSTNGTGIVNGGFNIPYLQAYGLCSQTPGIGSCGLYQEQTDTQEEIGIRKVRPGLDGYQKIRTWGIVNTTDLELSSQLTLRNIVSYQRLKSDYAYDADGTPIQQYDVQSWKYPDFPVDGLQEYGLPLYGWTNAAPNSNPRDNLKQFTEELQLQGNLLDDKLQLTVGGFYYSLKPSSLWEVHQVVYCPAAYTGTCGANTQIAGVSTKSKALYAQATLDLGALSPSLERLKLTAGYRYTWDTINGFTSSWGLNTQQQPACAFDGYVFGDEDPFVACQFTGNLKSKAPTWTIGLDYKPTNDLLLYAKISRGYKAGGFNPYAVRTTTTVFTPEKLTNYEGGFKFDTRLGSMPARLNATYYYADYKDIQQASGDYNPETQVSGAAFFQRAATLQGVEVEAMIKPAPWLQIGATVSHTDGDYKDSDIPFVYILPWQYNVNATIDLPIPEEMGNLSFYANYAYQADQHTNPKLDRAEPGEVLESYGLLNLSLNWQNVAQSNFDVSLFVSNATDKKYRIMNTNVFNSLLVAGELYGEPRMYGVKLRYNFGK
ncbi:hypothetical protein MB02_14115 [Croceicoccus estronivorus]|uniref:TonB-dependent receptor n=1 Tax=Croceicoccus estronivorus TaxID=1172626 RepID=UPI00082E6AB2|nr:TonB-dependent receptor [Croceicoccus estronivorus]OCC22901.1 hypothetical protein MB02_14115 [Croceicoccus estronivorus]